MGVMVPNEDIIRKAKEENVDIIGLSGLITPSLDEMVDMAKEMERQKMSIPLLLGGATTSRIHTAVKVDPHYQGSVIYVADASKSVPVAQMLLTQKEKIHKDTKEQYALMRENYGKGKKAETISLEQARINAPKINWDSFQGKKPSFTGAREISDISLATLIEYIDWTPFFQTWKLKGTYPGILTDKVYGEEATKLFNDAKDILQELNSHAELHHKAIVGFFKANSQNEDIILYNDHGEIQETLCMLRTQRKMQNTESSNKCLADYIAPASSQKEDYMGGFIVTAGLNISKLEEKYAKDHDDYSAILLKSLTDRLAESFAEYMHEYVRKELWGYNKIEALSKEDLIKESYQGIRPAPGYSACPDHSEKQKLFKLLNGASIGVELTESCAMSPASSVSGWYFSHPESSYFNVGKIEKDQVIDYSKRKKLSLEKAEKWLRPNLNYN
jgi:5-methyltetrahydrofolate--homocysteine methyltransferase